MKKTIALLLVLAMVLAMAPAVFAAESGTADAGEDSKWTYAYTPAQNGTLTVTVGDGTSNWSSDVAYFGADWSMVSVSGASGTAEDSYTAEVEAGTKYFI